MNPEASDLNAIAQARRLLGTCRVEELRAPVMAAPGMYLARVSHRDRVITLNGHALDREANRPEARARWIAHELFHLWRLEDASLCAPEREEAEADAFAEKVWKHLC